MGRSYGTAHDAANEAGAQDQQGHGEVGENTGVDDNAPLLGSAATPKREEAHEGTGTIPSSVGNLANTIIGSGMLTFPLAMASSGLIPGIVTCIFSGCCAALGLYLLSLCAPYAPKRHASFFAISEITFPKAAVLFDLAIAIKCFGVSISYLIIIKSLMPQVVESLYHDLSAHDAPEWTQSTNNWLTIFMLVLIPLSFLRKIDQLKHTSYIALFSAAYLVVIVLVCYVHPLKGSTPPGNIYLVHFTPNFVANFPVQVFAFTCAQNLFPIYNELKVNTQKRMTTIIATSIGSAALTYEVIAILGYLTFGDKVGANIIQMYPSTSLFVAFGQLAIVVLVLFSYPLQVQPCRNCLDKVLGRQPKKPEQTSSEDDEDEVESEMQPIPMSALKHLALTALIVASGYMIAYVVHDLQIVLAFVGSTGSTTISFILPGLFYWKLFRDRDSEPRIRLLRSAAMALTIYGFCILVFCLSFNIYSVVTGRGVAH